MSTARDRAGRLAEEGKLALRVDRRRFTLAQGEDACDALAVRERGG